MIIKIDLEKDRGLIITIALAVVVTIMMYLFFYAPLVRALKTHSAELTLLQERLGNGKVIIKLAGRCIEPKELVTPREASIAMDEMTQLGKSMGIEFRAMKPQEIAKGESPQYEVLPLEMEIAASTERISKFLGSFDELKRSIVKVKSFVILREKPDEGPIEADIIVNMLLSSEANAA